MRFSDDTLDELIAYSMRHANLKWRARMIAFKALNSMAKRVLDKQATTRLINTSLGDASGWHITRKSMYASLDDRLVELDSPQKTCLAISASKFFGQILGLNQCAYVEADYPEHDIVALRFPNDAFDFCISDQVLEHVEGDPFVAFKESARVAKPGGFIVHTSCLINEVHGVPKDFWRYTTDALSLLATSAGCEVVETGSWGNREAWALIHAGFRTSPIPDDPRNPLYQLAMRNEISWPIVTWVICRKPDLDQTRNRSAGGQSIG